LNIINQFLWGLHTNPGSDFLNGKSKAAVGIRRLWDRPEQKPGGRISNDWSPKKPQTEFAR